MKFKENKNIIDYKRLQTRVCDRQNLYVHSFLNLGILVRFRRFRHFILLSVSETRGVRCRTAWIIAVVINMFRLPDLLTGENVMCYGLKLL
jgi:hypothetical protein